MPAGIGDFASNFRVSNTISDHMALQVSLACQRHHPERKEIYVRSLRRIDKDALSAGLSAICVNHECSNVYLFIQHLLSALFTNKYALMHMCLRLILLLVNIMRIYLNY